MKFREKRLGYDDAQAEAILMAARAETHSDEAHRQWVPWIAAFSGARLEEICGANVADVYQFGGVWCLDISLRQSRGAGFAEDEGIRAESATPPSNHRRGIPRICGGASKDYRLTPNMLVGAAVGGGGTDWNLNSGGTGHSDDVEGGIYGMSRFGDAYLSGVFGYGHHDLALNRTVTVGAVSDRSGASVGADHLAGRAEGGQRFQLLPDRRARKCDSARRSRSAPSSTAPFPDAPRCSPEPRSCGSIGNTGRVITNPPTSPLRWQRAGTRIPASIRDGWR